MEAYFGRQGEEWTLSLLVDGWVRRIHRDDNGLLKEEAERGNKRGIKESQRGYIKVN